MRTKAQKWGNSLAVRVPRAIAEQAGIHPEDSLEIEVVRGRIVLSPTASIPESYSLASLVAKIRPRSRYREEDFGAPQGREGW